MHDAYHYRFLCLELFHKLLKVALLPHIYEIAANEFFRNNVIFKISKYKKCLDYYYIFQYRRYDDDLENTWGCASWCEYILTVIISSALLVGATALTLFWVIYYRDGFAWSENTKIQFNLHPVLMVAGFITLSGFCKSFIAVVNKLVK